MIDLRTVCFVVPVDTSVRVLLLIVFHAFDDFSLVVSELRIL